MKIPNLLLLPALTWALTTQNLPGAHCPTIIPQVAHGSALRGKVGFECDDCPKTYYLVRTDGLVEIQYSLDVWGFPYDHATETYYEWVGGIREQVDPDRNSDGSPREDGCNNTDLYIIMTTDKYAYYRGGVLGDPPTTECLIMDDVHEPPGCEIPPGHGRPCFGVNYDCEYLSTCGVERLECVYESDTRDERGNGTYVRCTKFDGDSFMHEYTTGALQEKVRALALDRLPTQFSTDHPVLAQTPEGLAKINADQDCASAKASLWRAKITHTVKGERYRISYNIVTLTRTGGIAGSTIERFEIVRTAPAETWWFPSAAGEVIEPPGWLLGHCLTGDPGEHSIMYTDFRIDPADSGNSSPGSGGPGGGDSPCASCGPISASGSPTAIDFHVAMGMAWSGGLVGEFHLAASRPVEGLGTPVWLTFTGDNDPAAGVEVVRNPQGVILQVVAPQGFAVVEPTSGTSYEITVYNPAARGAWDGAKYGVLNPSANLVVTWTIEELVGDPFTVQISQLRGAQERTWIYSHDTTAEQWILLMPGHVGERRTSQWTDPTTGDRTDTVQIAAPGATVVREWSRTYGRFDWGEAIIQETDGSGTGALTTLYDYYPDAASAGFTPSSARPPLRLLMRPDGGWEQYELYDTAGRPLLVLSAIDTDPTSVTAQCRSTEYAYSPIDPADDGSLQPHTPRAVIERFKGTETGRAYRIVEPGRTREIRCQTPGAAPDAADNLITTNFYYTSGDFAGRLRNVDRPDGTRTVYLYSRAGSGPTSTHTQVTLTGQIDPTPGLAGYTNILSGTIATTTFGALGETQSRDLRDKPSLILLAQESYTYLDNFKLSHSVTFLDGTSITTQYDDCCGLESVTDRDGAVTQHIHDDAGRHTASLHQGVTTTNILDAAGNALVTQRIGTDLSTLTLSQTGFDAAGRILSQTNALGGVTTFSESKDGQGQTVRTTIFHDGGTRIETFFKDGQLRTVSGTAVQPVEYRYGIASDGTVQRLYSAEIRLTATGGTNEWTRTYFDMLGRPYKTVHDGAGSPYQQSFYNDAGQLWKTRDPDNVITLYGYNARGEQEYVVQAISATARGFTNYDTFVSQFGSLQSGTDRITRTVSDVLFNATHGFNVRRHRTYVWPTDNQNVSLLVSTVETSTDGLRSWHTVYRDPGTPVVTRTVTAYSGNGNRTVTRTAPDGSYAMHAFSYGRLSSVIRRGSTHAQVGRTTYGYDTHGRKATITDFRNGATAYTFNAADLPATITTPASGTGAPSQTTQTHYNPMLQAIRIVQPDGSSLTNEFHLTGLLKRTSGTRVYPVGYGYDAQGRMKTMTNWSGFAGGSGARVTTWNYDTNRGWLDNKRYPDATGPNYTYTDAGRLKTRLWARGNPRVTTTYGYNYAGELSTVTYANDPAGTPNLSYTYDRRGRQQTVVQGSTMTTTMYYNDANLLTGEAYSGATAVLKDMSVTNVFDAYLRRTSLTGRKDGTTLVSGTYGYDTAGRLSTVTDGTFNSTYTYLANSPLIGQITHRQSSTVRMTETRQYDLLNRLTSITSTPASAAELPVGFSYQYNQANQRVRATLQDGSFWVYEYDSLGQVTSGKRFWSDGTPVPGQQFEYGFDDIGNRTSTRAGGDSAGTGLRWAGYTNNVLNQISSRGVPGAFDVVGIANAQQTVSVNNAGVDYRRGEYFQKLVSVNNTNSLVWTNVPVTSSGGGSISGKVYVPKTPEQYQYDLDGNLTQDGRWTYTWDAENRLIQITSLAAMPEADKRRGNYAYDHQGRRIWKRVDYKVGGNWTTFMERKFLYDRWNLMVELFTNDTAVKRFHWGVDLSGSEHGAGGVGGLLKVWDHYTGNHCFVGYDGNGNVMALVLGHDTPAGTYRARFEYSPFGEPIRSSAITTLGGTDARGMPFRFSTKYTDYESDLVYYGYRYYNPTTGRWVNRDPIGEEGGGNLHGFIGNSPINHLDPDGRQLWNPITVPPPFVPFPPTSLPAPGSKGNNAKRPGSLAYLWTNCCKSKKDRLSPIPDVLTPPRPPIRSAGPGTGTYEIFPFPTNPPSAVGGGGAGPCNLLVVKCSDFVAVFHFTVGDSPSGTLGMFSWPSGCSAIICGGDDSGQSNCLGDKAKSAAKAAGLDVLGVSGHSGCGVDAAGNWWQHGT
jgi:RHS repeat-associated protein